MTNGLFLKDRRGQTLQDYAIGVGLFLLVVIFVLTFIPGVLAPYGAVDDAERSAQAERASLALLADVTIDGEGTTIDEAALEALEGEDLATELGLISFLRVNVTLIGYDTGDVEHTLGDSYHDEDAGVWTRIVTTNDSTCDPACRMVVRVW